jgi:nucleotide-binding universal stress UspA family protein
MNPSILAATDLSQHASAAVARAGALASAHDWPLHLAHVIHPGLLESLQVLLGLAPEELGEQHEASVLQAMAALLPATNQSADPLSQCSILHGKPAETLAQQARQLAARLLVVGAHGQGFFNALRLGRTATRLIRCSPCPVLVVKQAVAGNYRRVLVATDFFPPSVAALRLARELLPDATIVLLHAVETPFEGKMQHAGVASELIDRYRNDAEREGLTKLHELVAREGLPADTEQLTRHGDIARLIVEEAQARDCDLIVVGKHGLGPIEDFLLGSTTLNVLRETDRDVLVSL